MRNARVWRYFLRNLAWSVGIAAYIFVSLTAGTYIALLYGFDPKDGMMTSMLVMLVFPMLAYLIRDMWQDAKQKVADENEEVMRVLRK